jgi:hypothetical protein
LPLLNLSWEDLRWVIIAMMDAKSAAHQDVLSTVIRILCGWKLWALGVVDNARNDGAGDFGDRRAFNRWDSRKPMTDVFRWEFILLGPNMTL